MAKKPGGRKHQGWPVDKRPAGQRKARIVERISEDLRRRTLPEEKFREVLMGALKIATGWSELLLTLPRPWELAAALRPLSDPERKSFRSKASRSPRRRRARQKAYGRLFDERVRRRLRSGFEAALTRAASQQEIEAVGAGLCLLADDVPIDPVENPLLALVTDMVSGEAEVLEQALAEFRRVHEAAEGEDAPPHDEARQRFDEFLKDQPAAAIAFSRFISYSVQDLMHGIVMGRIKACLTEEELAPLLDDMDRADPTEPSAAAAPAPGEEAEAPPQDGQPAAPAPSQEAGAPAAAGETHAPAPGEEADAAKEGGEPAAPPAEHADHATDDEAPEKAGRGNIYRRFATVMDNQAAFERFDQEFAAEAEAARAVEDPSPDDDLVVAVADYLESGAGPSDLNPAVIAQASALRILRERMLKARDKVARLEAEAEADAPEDEQTAAQEDGEDTP